MKVRNFVVMIICVVFLSSCAYPPRGASQQMRNDAENYNQGVTVGAVVGLVTGVIIMGLINSNNHGGGRYKYNRPQYRQYHYYRY